MNFDHALAGDMRFNPDTQMTEVYNGDRWIAIAQKLNDQSRWEDVKKQFDASFDKDYNPRDVQEWIDEKVKEKALNELFGVN